MRRLIFSFFILASFTVWGQSDRVAKDDIVREQQITKAAIKDLHKENRYLRAELHNINDKLFSLNKNLDSLRAQTNNNQNAISRTDSNLGMKIGLTEKTANEQIAAVGNSLSKKSLYGIIGVLSTLLLTALLFRFLSKKQQTDKTDLIDKLSKTKSDIEESLVKEFGRQAELMDAQLLLIEQQQTNVQTRPNTEPDHALPLKLASEINLIERNINLMDPKTKGLKQLQASVGRLKDNLSANGYEMPELLGKPFNPGMRVVVATSVPDENLEKGQEKITKILIPQVNYNGKMIQTAQIEVSVGY